MSQVDITKEPARRRIIDDKAYHPWVRAQQMDDCFLFWLPVSEFPMRHDEKHWLSDFMDRLSSRLEQEHGLRSEVFLQYKLLHGEMANAFLKYRRKCFTLMGLGRRPGATVPALPTSEQLQQVVKDNKPFDLNNWVADYSYWFLMKQPQQQRELFLGFGGMTTIFLKPDPKTIAPKLPYTPALRAAHPAFKRFDIDAVHAATYAADDAFLEKSKTLFGSGLEEEVQYDGLAFILPLLDSGHFFAVTSEMRAQWFDLFDVYINESNADGGMILAFKKDFEDMVIDILDAMSAEGRQYPGKSANQ